jgi:hypothetical protein
MRTDSPVYASSAQSLQNMIVLSSGAVKKRTGLKYQATNAQTDKTVHLSPFVFDDNEEYIIAIGDGYVLCYYLNASGGLTLVSTITQDVNSAALPFDKDYINQYTTAQYGDVMFICHPLFAPRLLTRTSLTAFNVSTFSFDTRIDNRVIYQPYTRFHGTGVTLDPDKVIGAGAILTTSADYFTANHVGSVIRYHKNEINITSVQSATQATGNIVGDLNVRLSVLNPLRTSDGSDKIEVTQLLHGFAGGEAITVIGASALGGINTAQINGSRTVHAIIDENTYSFTAGGTANAAEDGGGYVIIGCHAPTDNWDEQSFSAARGYPAAVTFHENRLCLAGTIAEPDTIWMSKIGNFFNFDVGDADDTDSINLVAATGDVNEIRYLVSNRDLQVFTLSDELYVPTYLNQAMTPTNAQIRRQTPYGCSFVKPASIDGATIFSERGGRSVREYLYSDSENAYVATSISSLASHITNDPVDLTVVHSGFNQSQSYAAMVMGDGSMSLFSSSRSEKRAAWSHVSTGGNFTSATSVGSRLFVSVLLDSGAAVFSEFTGEVGLDAYLDIAYGTGTLNISGVYASGTVDVIGYTSTTSAHLGSFDVTAGNITVTAHSDYTNFYVGKKFDAKIVSNPVDAALGAGPATGQIRGVSSVVLNLNNITSVKVNGRTFNEPSGFTGNKEFRLLGYSRNPQVTIEQDSPMPLQVNGLISELVV